MNIVEFIRKKYSCNYNSHSANGCVAVTCIYKYFLLLPFKYSLCTSTGHCSLSNRITKTFIPQMCYVGSTTSLGC